MTEEQIQKMQLAKSNILKGEEIEAAAYILEKCVFDNVIIIGERVNYLKIATRQILDFIKRYKESDYETICLENNELREIADRIQSEYNELLNKKRINSEYKPCIVRNKKALFHKWVHTKNLLGQEFEVGLVEYENGQIGETTPNSIKFCDAKLDEYCFTKEE